MKLSEKGYLKIGNSIVGWFENGVAKVTFDPDKIEFKPDDFKGCVVLTIDEAEQIEQLLNGFVSLHNDDCLTVRNDIFDAVVAFKKRIEQAEKSK